MTKRDRSAWRRAERTVPQGLAPTPYSGEGNVRPRALAYLADRGAAGATTREIVAALHCSMHAAGEAMRSAAASGEPLMVAAEPGEKAARRYWLGRHAPAHAIPLQGVSGRAWLRNQAPQTVLPARRRDISLDRNAPAIVPPDVKVTICPAGRDFRFTLRPDEPVYGCGFAAEWRALRGEPRPARKARP